MFIVLFEEGKQPLVLNNVNPQSYDGRKILVNPVLPRGVPPHRWKMGKGCIEVIPEEVPMLPVYTIKASDLPSVSLPPAPKSSSMLKHHLIAALVATAISILLKVL